MNTAHDEACSMSKNAVMDCKFTSPELMFLLAFCSRLTGRYRLFSRSSNTSVATIASRATKVCGARQIAKRISFGVIRKPHLSPHRREDDKLPHPRRRCCPVEQQRNPERCFPTEKAVLGFRCAQCRPRRRVARLHTFEVSTFTASAVEVVIRFKSYDNCLLAWCHHQSDRKRERRHGHNIQHNKGRYVLENPALHPLRVGPRPAGSAHASGGDRFDAGATGGGRFRRPRSDSGSFLCHADRRRLPGPSTLWRLDLHQIPYLC